MRLWYIFTLGSLVTCSWVISHFISLIKIDKSKKLIESADSIKLKK